MLECLMSEESENTDVLAAFNEVERRERNLTSVKGNIRAEIKTRNLSITKQEQQRRHLVAVTGMCLYAPSSENL
jgi:hypothetical protein